MATDADLLAENGTISSFSCSSDPRPTLAYYAFAAKGLNLRFIQGFNLPAEARHAAINFIETYASDIEIAIGARFELDRIAETHRRVESGGLGNTVVHAQSA